MRIYICDSCGVEIKDPHIKYMKEFYIGIVVDCIGVSPSKETRKKKMHLCDDCFKGCICWRKRRSRGYGA